MARELRVLSEGGHYFESPRWHAGTWWVSDQYAHTVATVAADGTRSTVLEVDGRPSGLGWLPGGDLLVVSMLDQRILRRSADGSVSVHAELAPWCRDKANDMVVDGLGRAYVGCFGFDLLGGADPEPSLLIRVDPDGAVIPVAVDLLFPNGSVVVDDGRTLVVGETLGARYSAFTIEDDGSLRDRRVWAQLAPTPPMTTFGQVLADAEVAPDGCTADAEGCIWSADVLGARVIRVAEGGAVLDEVPMPRGVGAFACMLGGEDGRELLVCAAPDFDEDARLVATESLLLTTTVDVPHAGHP